MPKTNALKQTWTKPDFDDSKWRAGIGGVGYDFRPDYKSLIGVDVRDEAAGKFPSVLTRSLFKWDGSPIEKLVLNLKFEDGFIAYLNGVRVASHNAPKIANNVASAWGQHMDGEAMRWKPFDLSAHTDLLVTGKDNVLAIQTMNDRVGSSDLLIYPELVAEREISGTEITLGKGVREVRARAFEMDRWGPMRVVPIVTGEAGAATLAAAGNVVISEIMYHPGEPTAEEAADVSEDHDDFEFVEGPLEAAAAPAHGSGRVYENPTSFFCAASMRWPIALSVLLLAGLRLRRRQTPDPTLALAHLDDSASPPPLHDLHPDPQADEEQASQAPQPSIGRELRAVAVLFAALCVLPWLAGSIFGV